MAFDAFLKIDGIKGESQDAKHKGEIDIMNFSWGASQTGSTHGSGMGEGRVALQDFCIRKKVDCSSPLLFANCTAGTHFKEASFVVRKAGGTQLEYLKYKFSDLLISRVNPQGTAAHVINSTYGSDKLSQRVTEAGGDEIPYEDVSLNYGRVEITYQPQSPTGAAQGGPILAGWDLKANKKV